MKFGMVAPYQSNDIWAVNSQENHEICCHQMSNFKAEMHQNWLGELSALPDPLAGIKGTYLILREGQGCRTA